MCFFLVSDVEEVRRGFKKFTVSFKEETDRIRSLSNENHSSLINVQVSNSEYRSYLLKHTSNIQICYDVSSY